MKIECKWPSRLCLFWQRTQTPWQVGAHWRRQQCHHAKTYNTMERYGHVPLTACPPTRIGHSFHKLGQGGAWVAGRPGRPSASTHKDCMSCSTRPPDGAYTRWLSSAGILTSLVVGGKYVWCDVDVDTQGFVQLGIKQGTTYLSARTTFLRIKSFRISKSVFSGCDVADRRFRW